jgi:flavin reductase (DIM6/NTAB) family NADH-FMN oxidoreductase RutF
MTKPTVQAGDNRFDVRHFRDALSQFATGVTVITTRLTADQSDGKFIGITASSFNSVSLNPPLVLWSLSKSARSLPVFRANSHYLINVLSANQAALADRFAKPSEDRFAGVGYTLSEQGLPILDGVAAWFECSNRSRYPEGDHVIFVGEVEQCRFTPGAPLVFHGGQLMNAGT